LAPLVQHPQSELGARETLCSRERIEAECLSVVLRHALAAPLHQT
jgi:hypothetical protein